MRPRANNKYRSAVNILKQGRDVIVDALANDVVSQGEDLIEGGFLFNEFLEVQGTRLHFLSLLVSQLEQAAEMIEESEIAASPPPISRSAPKKRAKAKPKKVQHKLTSEESTDEI